MTREEFHKRFTYNIASDKLGEGGFGDVYRAKDHARNREVAIKISKVKKIGNKEVSLRSEYAHISKLEDHPNIAHYENVYQYSTETGIFDFAIMQLYPEGNLKQLISEGIKEDGRVEVVNGLLDGLGYLHSNNILHRDIKPSNVLISNWDEKIVPKITDFGLSKLLDSEDIEFSNSLSGIGTFDYTSPEQLAGQKLNFQSDLWSFGILVFELYTGQKPFSTGTSESNIDQARIRLFQNIVNAPIPYILESLPYNVQAVIRSCLIKEVKDRVPNVETLRDIYNDPLRYKSIWEKASISEPSGVDGLFAKYENVTPEITTQLGSIQNVIDAYEHALGNHKTVSLEKIWNETKSNNTIEGYQKFQKQHPKSKHIKEAKTLLAALQTVKEEKSWVNAKDNNTVVIYKSFLETNPYSKFSVACKTKIEALSSQADEENHWIKTQSRDDLLSYLEFLKVNPKSKYKVQAKARIKTLKEDKDPDASKSKTTSRFKILLLIIPIIFLFIAFLIFISKKNLTATADSTTDSKEKDITNILDIDALRKLAAIATDSITVQAINKQITVVDIIEYNKAIEQNTIESYDEYLTKFPEGSMKIPAIEKIETLVAELDSDDEDSFWNQTKRTGSIPAIEIYLDKYPQGKYITEANNLISALRSKQETAYWEESKQLNTLTGYRNYLAQYPKGQYQDAANKFIAKLKENEDLQAWSGIKSRKDTSEIKEYITDYPESKYHQEALNLLSSLRPLISQEEKDFRELNQTTHTKNLDFLEKYPESQFKSKVLGYLDESTWKLVMKKKTCERIKTYIQQFPEGNHIREAMEDQVKLCATKPVVARMIASITDNQVNIAGDSYQLGCTDCKDKKYGRLQVNVGKFYISKYEVTQRLYELITGDRPSEYDYCANCPVQNVSYEDALIFISILNTTKNNPYTFRLPTEAEWEFAAGGSRQEYSGSRDIDAVAVYSGNANEVGASKVGSKKPNRNGLYDMSGNVSEWVSDDYAETYGGAPNSKGLKTIRGGSWMDNKDKCRTTARRGAPKDYFNETIGFRLVRTN